MADRSLTSGSESGMRKTSSGLFLSMVVLPASCRAAGSTTTCSHMVGTPGGKHLLVVHTLPDRTSQIAMISVQDGSIRVLKSFGWQRIHASISPDGRYIAYDSPADDKTQAR